jgi:hypothetical protein
MKPTAAGNPHGAARIKAIDGCTSFQRISAIMEYFDHPPVARVFVVMTRKEEPISSSLRGTRDAREKLFEIPSDLCEGLSLGYRPYASKPRGCRAGIGWR